MIITDILTTGAIFFLILSILVFVHELGHFLVAVAFGVRVDEFGFGLPPQAKKLTTVKIRGNPMDITLNWLPIGGFVRLAGEDELEETIEESLKKYKGKNLKQFFWARSKKERAAILLAGVTMNFLLAVLLTTGLLIKGLEEPAPRVRVEGVLANSPAHTAGLQPGDSILSVRPASGSNRLAIPTRLPAELVAATRKYLDTPIELEVLRNGETQKIVLTPRSQFPEGEGPMGVKIGFDIQLLKFPWYQAPIEAFKLNISRAKDMIMALATLPARALQGQQVKDELAGPIGIAQVTGQAAKIGLDAVVNLMSILSLSLAMLNVLPFPALDGGRLLFVFLEKAMGKPVKPAVERVAHQVGMLLLLAFILFVTFNDLTRVFGKTP